MELDKGRMLGVELRLHGHCFVSGVMGSRGKGFLGRSCTKLGIAKGAIVLFFLNSGEKGESTME